jgi:hypothetical protein
MMRHLIEFAPRGSQWQGKRQSLSEEIAAAGTPQKSLSPSTMQNNAPKCVLNITNNDETSSVMRMQEIDPGQPADVPQAPPRSRPISASK